MKKLRNPTMRNGKSRPLNPRIVSSPKRRANSNDRRSIGPTCPSDDGIPVKAMGRYVRAEPDVDWPEGIEDLEIFSEDTGERVPEEDLSESDNALAVEALIDTIERIALNCTPSRRHTENAGA